MDRSRRDRAADKPGLVRRVLDRFARAVVDVHVVPTGQGGSKLPEPHDFKNLADQGYRKNVIIYACLNELMTSIAGIPWGAHRLGRDGESAPLDPGHQLSEILRRPSRRVDGEGENISRNELVQMLVLSRQGLGNGFVYKQRSGAGLPAGLRTLRVDYMDIIRRKGDGAVSHYMHGVPPKVDPIAVDDVIHFRLPNPLDDYWGLSPIGVLARWGDIDESAAKYLSGFFAGGGTPKGLLKFKVRMVKEARDRAAAAWDYAYSGEKGHHATAVIDSEVDFQKTGASPAEADLSHIFSESEMRICAAFQVPPILIGVYVGARQAPRAIYETARQSLYGETVIPICDAIGDKLTVELASEFGDDIAIRFDYSGIEALKKDRTPERTFWLNAWDKQAATLNEFRVGVGMDPVDEGEGGDEYKPLPGGGMSPLVGLPAVAGDADVDAPPDFVAPSLVLNGAQVTAAMAIVESVAAGLLPRDAGIGSLITLFNLSKEQAEAIMGSVGKGFTPTTPQQQGEQQAKPSWGSTDKETPGWRALGGPTVPYSPEPPRLPFKCIDTDGYTAAEMFASPVDDIASAAEFDPDDPMVKEMEQIFHDILERHGTQQAAMLSKALGVVVEFSADTPRITKWLEQKTIKFADEAFDKYAGDVKEIVSGGLKEGRTYQDMAAELDTLFEGRKNNALTVARTESVGTANYGRTQSMLEAELEEHIWITQRDENVRDRHKELDGKVTKIGTPFPGTKMHFPGDSERGDLEDFINDRCDTVAVIPGVPNPEEQAIVAQWEQFAKALDSDEEKVAKQYLKMVDEQQARVMKAAGIEG